MSEPIKGDIASRLFGRIERLPWSGCWIWMGYIRETGYGEIYTAKGRRPSKTHRVAWEIANQRHIPDGMFVCHSCDVPACINPAHLWIGTQKENMEDASIKGRVIGLGSTRKTHCPKGHPYDATNTYMDRNGARNCRHCHAAKLRARRKREREELHA
jgi:hypothetical protein